MSHNNDPDLTLQRIRNGIDRREMTVEPILQHDYVYGRQARRKLVHWSRLRRVLEQQQSSGENSTPSFVYRQCRNHLRVDRAVGCLLGLALGDTVGAPLEFLPVTTTSENMAVDVTQLDPSSLQLRYTPHAPNCFHLQPGQWTDDTSMALCLAESMLCSSGYNGARARIAYYNWWVYGYCNAFRHDARRCGSVGLGGNIRDSLYDVATQSRKGRSSSSIIPPEYQVPDGTEDAGNGSLMRLAPIAIRYCHESKQSLCQVAALSSRATHPGPDAAWCCQFLAYLCAEAIMRPPDQEHTAQPGADDDGTKGDCKESTIPNLIDETIQSFLDYHHHQLEDIDDSSNTASFQKLASLLTCKPPSPEEACWDWKRPNLLIEDTIVSRGHRYNGYPVSEEYFGSYCMDGLAMALWAAYRSTSVVDTIGRVVNLLGDCDTTGAICGQIAGAYFGYSNVGSTVVGQRLLDNLHYWDPLWEMEMRAILLFWDGEEDEEEEDDTDDTILSL